MAREQQRRIVSAVHKDGSVYVDISTYNGGLMKSEAAEQADSIASAVMKVLAEQTRYLSVPLSRITVQRRRKS